VLTCFARAQGGPPLVTDDPGTPGDGKFEINVATTLDRVGDASTFEAPLLDLNYGIGANVQLKYEIPWVWIDDGESANGLGNSLAGVKWRLCDDTEGGFALSIYPQVEFENPGSSSADRGLVESGTNVILPIEVAHDFGSFESGVEVGYVICDGDPDTWFAGLAGSLPAAEDFELVAELRMEGDGPISEATGFGNVGMRASLTETNTLLAAVGSGLWSSGEERTPGLQAYVGIQFVW
jgi:hypothetical protein